MSKIAQLLVFCSLIIIAGYSGPSQAQAPNLLAVKSKQATIQILVASWCVHCRDLEKFLRDQNLGYIRLDVEKDPKGRQLYQQLGGGGVPMVIIGNSVLKGFDREAILEMLSKAGPPVNSRGRI